MHGAFWSAIAKLVLVGGLSSLLTHARIRAGIDHRQQLYFVGGLKAKLSRGEEGGV
jgi:hypothetical protein